MPKTIGYPADSVMSKQAEDQLRYAREMLEFARSFRRTKREQKWRQAELQYEGKHWGNVPIEDTTADLVTVNISFSTVTTLVPYITGNTPRFLVEPYSGDATVKNARAQAAWLNRWWASPDSGAERAVKSSAVDTLVYGDGYGKVSWRIYSNPFDGAEIGELFVDRVDPWNIWIDPMADGIHNARFVVERIYTTMTELREDDRYSKAALEGVSAGVPDADDADRDTLMRAAESVAHDRADWVEIYEFWDLVEDRMLVFAPTGQYPLRIVEGAACPLVQLPNHWLPKQPYSMGDLEQIWSMQQELNKSRSQMLTHRRRNIPKFLVHSNALDDEGEAALSSEVVGAVVRVHDDRPLSDVIQAVGLSPLTADIPVSDLIMRDIFEITGVNEYLRGATPQIRRTATEASIIEGASNIKSAHKLSQIEAFTRDLGRLALLIAADVFPQTEYDEMELFISGRDAEGINRAMLGEQIDSMRRQGAPPDLMQAEAQATDLTADVGLALGPDVFQGVYQVSVVQNSTELRNPVFREQKYREMAQTLTQAAPALQQMGVTVNLRKVYELWFEAAGIDDIDAMFQPAQQGIPAQVMPGAAPQGGGGDLQSLIQGQPNLDGMGAPLDLLTAMNTGMLPPEGAA